MGGTSGMKLKVKPEELLVISEQVEERVTAMRQQADRIQDIVKRSASYWEADGQAAYVQAYQSKKDNIDTALRHFADNVTNLRMIANVYTTTERSAVEEANSLSEDVIV